MWYRVFVSVAFTIGCHLTVFSQTAHRFDIVIDECLIDPSPAIKLPASPFLELKNVSRTPYDLFGWKISNGTNAATIRTHFILQPDSFAIICSSTSLAGYQTLGPAIGVSAFPGFAQAGCTIELISPAGQMIHVVQYDKRWYQNDVAASGGHSLEMIDPKNPCTGYQNWIASKDPAGGTPGFRNSVDAPNADQRPPALVRTFTTDSLHVTLLFDEPLDSLSASLAANYELDHGVGRPASAFAQLPAFNQVVLQLNQPLNSTPVYQVTVHGVDDCSGNAIGGFNIAKTGIAIVPDTQDIVLNEILFNPPSYGYDYVEIYNRSQHIFNLDHLYLSNLNLNGTANDPKLLSDQPILFFPGEYYVFTENPDWVTQQYSVEHPDKLLAVPALPAMPDDNGSIALLNQSGNFVDALSYDHSWHFSLITNEEGVALERLSSSLPTQDQSNWSSAAQTAGYGTPTYRNSQTVEGNTSANELTVVPKIFSPDNDGYDDFCFIHYLLPETGYLANIVIFDANGRTVRKLVQNNTLTQEGTIKWDGLDDRQQRLPVGNYIIYVELFNGKGIVKKFREVVTLAIKL